MGYVHLCSPLWEKSQVLAFVLCTATVSSWHVKLSRWTANEALGHGEALASQLIEVEAWLAILVCIACGPESLSILQIIQSLLKGDLLVLSSCPVWIHGTDSGLVNTLTSFGR